VRTKKSLTLILAAILLEHCVAAISSECLPEEGETATSRPEGPFKSCKCKIGGCCIKKIFMKIFHFKKTERTL